jgi:hypothetical protein
MPENPFEQESDMRPWAAYVVGHHRCTLRLWHETLWYDLSYNGVDLAEQSWEPISTEIQELTTRCGFLLWEDTSNLQCLSNSIA